MNEVKVSICMLNIDRYIIGRYVLEKNLLNCGIPLQDIELLILDNGSKDKRAIDYLSGIANVFIQEQENIGVAKGFNKLLRKAAGQYVCLFDNDIILSDNWLKDFISFNKRVPKSGISAIHCVLEKGIHIPKYNIYVPDNGTVYSTRFFHRSLLESIGGFNENLSTYGYEDSELTYRTATAGYINYYLPNQYSTHYGADFGAKTEFRKFKDEELKANQSKFFEAIKSVKETGKYKIPL